MLHGRLTEEDVYPAAVAGWSTEATPLRGLASSTRTVTIIDEPLLGRLSGIWAAPPKCLRRRYGQQTESQPPDTYPPPDVLKLHGAGKGSNRLQSGACILSLGEKKIESGSLAYRRSEGAITLAPNLARRTASACG